MSIYGVPEDKQGGRMPGMGRNAWKNNQSSVSKSLEFIQKQLDECQEKLRAFEDLKAQFLEISAQQRDGLFATAKELGIEVKNNMADRELLHEIFQVLCVTLLEPPAEKESE